VWRPELDDGSRVEQLMGGHNYTTDGEYWRLTTVDGTQYYFGQNRRFAGDRETFGAQVVPVYSNHAGEPCYRGGFADSSCWHGYRWNLDYVVDPRGNTMRTFYRKIVGVYGHNNGQGTARYDITAAPTSIEYGTRADDDASVKAPMKVDFSTDNRCVTSGCQRDVPWDQFCDPATESASCLMTHPAFWTHLGLTAITTRVWSQSDGVYRDVDRWDLTHSYPDPGDGMSPSWWLDTVTHTGLAGAAPVAEPATRFWAVNLHNRVDWGEVGVPPLNYHRISVITSGSGRQTEIVYSQPECNRWDLPAAHNNAKRCFPQHFQQPGQPSGFAWFHKYVVNQIVDRDLVGGAPALEYAYTYSTEGTDTSVLWGFDQAEVTPVERRSWSTFRGYSMVTTTAGAGGGGPRQVTKSLFYRGLSNDRTDRGDETRVASIISSDQSVVADLPMLAGMLREEITVDNGAIAATTIHDPYGWVTATRSRPWQAGNQKAHRVREVATRARTRINTVNAWRSTEVRTGYNDYGLPTTVKDFGDSSNNNANADDDICTVTGYARNTGTYLIDYPAEATTRAGTDCSSGQRLAVTGSYYDGATSHGGAPTRGLPTTAFVLTSADPEGWATSRTGYDAYGRVTSTTDARGHTSSTVYTPAVGRPATVRGTNPLGHETSTSLDPVRGQPVRVTDPNGKVTTAAYDALGRLVKLWRPGRDPAAAPDVEYGYLLRNDGANVVTAKTLGPTGAQIASYELFDGLMRPRQTQKPGPAAHGGRIVADTGYDSRGLAVKAAAFHATGAPGDQLVGYADVDAPSQTRTSYDQQGRVAAEQLWSRNVMKWQTGYDYDGDRSTVYPPSGGASTTVVDAHGRPTALHQYPTSNASGTPDTTRYGYDRVGNLVSLTDPAGNRTGYGYDLAGRRVSASDPDSGKSTSVFSAAGDLLSTVDGRGQKMSFEYDPLGRVTSRWAGDVGTGSRLASFVFDTVAKGQPTSATRYDNGAEYVTGVTGYTDDYQPAGQIWSIPLAEGVLAGSYSLAMTYNPYTRAPATVSCPARHDLPAETLSYGYDDLGAPTTLAGVTSYVSATGYTRLGQLAERVSGAGRLRREYSYDEATGRLTSITAKTPTASGTWQTVQQAGYSYTPTGDITSITDGTDGQSQCYRYDPWHRLTEAYTAGDDCTADPAAGTVAGSGKYPYWTSWTFDTAGRRTTEVHRTTGAATTRTYTYPAVGAARPHAMTGITRTGTNTGTDSFDYDPAGNMSSHTLNGVRSDYTTNPEGRFAGADVHAPAGKQETRHLYDANGALLIRRDPAGTTLHAAGQEFKTRHRRGGLYPLLRPWRRDRGRAHRRRAHPARPQPPGQRHDRRQHHHRRGDQTLVHPLRRRPGHHRLAHQPGLPQQTNQPIHRTDRHGRPRIRPTPGRVHQPRPTHQPGRPTHPQPLHLQRPQPHHADGPVRPCLL
jgi:YD repeat-containing protein